MPDVKNELSSLRSFEKALVSFLRNGGTGDTVFNRRVRKSAESIDEILKNADKNANTKDDCKRIKAFNSQYDLSIGADKVVQMYVSDLKLVTPKDIKNDTCIVGVDINGKNYLGYDNLQVNLANDIDAFMFRYPGKNIDDYVRIYIPGRGYDFYLRTKVNNKKVFVLGRDKRHELIMLLAKQDMDMFDKYASVFMKYPISAEYQLSIYSHNKYGFYESCLSWFNNQVRLLYGKAN